MKSNNKGFSLVELLIAVLVSTIVFGAITALITFSSKSMRDTNGKVELQNQAKDALNHIESFCMECSGATWDSANNVLFIYNNKKGKKLFKPGELPLSDVSNNLSSYTGNAFVYWYKDNKIYFAKCATTGTDAIIDINALPSDNMYLLADNVEAFKCEVKQNAESDKYSIDVNMTFKNTIAEYSCNNQVYIRNQ